MSDSCCQHIHIFYYTINCADNQYIQTFFGSFLWKMFLPSATFKILYLLSLLYSISQVPVYTVNHCTKGLIKKTAEARHIAVPPPEGLTIVPCWLLFFFRSQCFCDNYLLCRFVPFDIRTELLGNKANRCVGSVVFDKCR